MFRADKPATQDLPSKGSGGAPHDRGHAGSPSCRLAGVRRSAARPQQARSIPVLPPRIPTPAQPAPQPARDDRLSRSECGAQDMLAVPTDLRTPPGPASSASVAPTAPPGLGSGWGHPRIHARVQESRRCGGAVLQPAPPAWRPPPWRRGAVQDVKDHADEDAAKDAGGEAEGGGGARRSVTAGGRAVEAVSARRQWSAEEDRAQPSLLPFPPPPAESALREHSRRRTAMVASISEDQALGSFLGPANTWRQPSLSCMSAASDPAPLIDALLRARRSRPAASTRSVMSAGGRDDDDRRGRRPGSAAFAESKFGYSVSGLPGSPAQASTAAAFFARAAQKLQQLPGSPHRRRMGSGGVAEAAAAGAAGAGGDEEAAARTFSSVIRACPPPAPPALLRRLGTREVTGVGKVKVMLRVTDFSAKAQTSTSTATSTSTPSSPAHGGLHAADATPAKGEHPPSASPAGNPPSYLSVDQRRKQVTLLEPPSSGALSGDAPDDRRVGVAAPKMFAFDAIYTDDDAQSEVCGGALTDLLHAVLNGNDGVLFCFGHSRQGAARTMLGTPHGPASLGAAPCAVAWLFRGIAELRARGNARFSVRVSAVEAAGGGRQPLRDLLAAHAHDSEQSPGVYLRDDPVLGTQLQNHCELRVPSAERAAHYLDCALAARTDEDAHLLFTLHVYQYSVAGKGGVAGGRSRLHLVDLGRGAAGLPLSSLGHVLLAIFNGQKHLPHREHRITQVLKECLSPITCHAAMLVHAHASQAYAETLATVQLAARIHRMRRRKIKFPGVNTACGPGLGHGPHHDELQQRGSDLEPSSSEQSADTVIYVGPATDDATDGEHPPVYLPGLADGDHRGAMGRALRGSSAEHHRPHGSPGPGRARTKQTPSNSPKSSPVRNASSAKSSPAKSAAKGSTATQGAGGAEERWIDGPRVSKSRVVEARTLILKEGHAKRETWVDGPLQKAGGLAMLGNGPASGNYGFMDSHKKSMIRRWVENQTVHMKHLGVNLETAEDVAMAAGVESEDDDGLVDPKFMADSRHGRAVNGRAVNGRSGARLSSGVRHRHDDDPRVRCAEIRQNASLDLAKGSEPQRPDHLSLTSTTTSRLAPAPACDQGAPCVAVIASNMPVDAPPAALGPDADVASECTSVTDESAGDLMDEDDDDDMLLEVTNVGDDVEIIEVLEPSEPVPMVDCCLQVTEEDIALCMGENPLPEVDQDGPVEHPLRVLSQENLTVVSTFADTLSLASDLESTYCPLRSRFGPPPSFPGVTNMAGPACCRLDHGADGTETEHHARGQLARLHDQYRTKLAAATSSRRAANAALALPPSAGPGSRCTSLSLSDVLHGVGSNGAASDSERDGDGDGEHAVNDAGSIYSEPPYRLQQQQHAANGHCNGTLCDNCQRSFAPTSWHSPAHTTTRTRSSTLQSYYGNLRHPDGASNPDLKEEALAPVAPLASVIDCEEIERKIDAKLKAATNGLPHLDAVAALHSVAAASPVDSDEEPVVPPPLPASPTSRLHQRLLSLSDHSASPRSRSSTPVSGDCLPSGLPGLTTAPGPGSAASAGSAGSGTGSGTGSGSGGSGSGGSGNHGSSSGYESLGSAPPSCSGRDSREGRDSGKEDAPGVYGREERGWASATSSPRARHHHRGPRRDKEEKETVTKHWTYERSPTAGCLPDSWAWCWCSSWSGDKCDRPRPRPLAAPAPRPAPVAAAAAADDAR